MNTMKRLNLYAGLGVILWSMLSSSLVVATAAPVTFSFVGDVTSVHPDLGSTFSTSQTLTGSYTFDPATVGDSNPNGNIGRYNGAITNLNVTIGSYTATLGNSGSNFIEIRNLASERYEVRAPLTGPLVGGFSPLRFRIELINGTGAFSSDELTATPPSLNAFVIDRFRLVFEDGNGTARVRGSLTALTAVSLPAAFLLFGAGLVALVGLGAGSWRRGESAIA